MPKRNLIWLAVVVATAGLSVLVARSTHSPSAPVSPRSDALALAHELIQTKYYGELSDDILRKSAVAAMVEQLDEFSTYVPAERVEAFDQRIMGQGRGAGVRLARRDGKLVTRWPVYASPAHRAGIVPGMVLLGIDDRPVGDLTPRQARALLAGVLDSEVRLRLLTPDGRPREVTLRRAEFPVESVRGVLRGQAGWRFMVDRDRRIACIGVCEFVRDTARDVQTALSGLSDPAGVILDLRDNPGGLLEEAVQLANLFLEEGQIVAVAERKGVAQRHFARKADTCAHVPLVVLVNEGTASAAEIVAGALSYHSRALIVGERSCGKGSIQSMLLLPRDLGQINLTTGEFLLAGRVSILRRAQADRWGVEPDVPVAIDPDEREGLDALRAEAGALRRSPADEPSRRPDARTDPAPRPGPERIVEDLLALDAPLRRAVELLGDDREHRALLRRSAAAWRRRLAEADNEGPAP